MPRPNPSTPPPPPDVRKQQAPRPPLAVYAQNAMSNGAAPGAGPTKEFVKQQLASIAASLAKVAKVLAIEQPELMPIVTRMAGAGKMLETEYNKASQGQGAPSESGPEPAAGPPPPEGQDSTMSA